MAREVQPVLAWPLPTCPSGLAPLFRTLRQPRHLFLLCFSEAHPPSKLLARLIPAQPLGLRTDGQDKSPSWELVPVLIFTIFSALLRVTQSLSPLVSCSCSSLPLSPLPPFFTHSTSLAFCSELLKQFPCPFVGRVPFPVLRCRYRVRRGPSPPDPAYAVPLPASRREGMHT